MHISYNCRLFCWEAWLASSSIANFRSFIRSLSKSKEQSFSTSSTDPNNSVAVLLRTVSPLALAFCNWDSSRFHSAAVLALWRAASTMGVTWETRAALFPFPATPPLLPAKPFLPPGIGPPELPVEDEAWRLDNAPNTTKCPSPSSSNSAQADAADIFCCKMTRSDGLDTSSTDWCSTRLSCSRLAGVLSTGLNRASRRYAGYDSKESLLYTSIHMKWNVNNNRLLW